MVREYNVLTTRLIINFAHNVKGAGMTVEIGRVDLRVSSGVFNFTYAVNENSTTVYPGQYLTAVLVALQHFERPFDNFSPINNYDFLKA